MANEALKSEMGQRGKDAKHKLHHFSPFFPWKK